MIKSSELRLMLYPKNFETTSKFYQNILGFPVLYKWNKNNSKGIMFNTGSAVLEFLYPIKKKPTTGMRISLKVSNVKILWKKLKNKTEVVFPIRDNEWGDTSFSISDPDGNELIFFTPWQKKVKMKK
jgi:catechol 2,3-dioxygenase-like lactoylglutathione lyase family enzyme